MEVLLTLDRKEIKPAKSVLEDTQKFLHDWLPNVGKKAKGVLNAIIHHNRNPGESPLETDDDLINHLNSIPLQQLSNYVNFEVDQMKDASAKLDQKRSRGFHKRTAQLQGFAVTFSQFLQAYSGIVSIVQSADSQYGNVAFAALSLLFATVKIKAEAEESIHRCILHISDRMPDFEVYRRIYPDPKLGLMLAEAYRSTILFAREVTIYYQAHGFVRYIRHINRVGEFQLLEKEMRENSNRISTRCDVLLAERIDKLTEDNRMIREMAKTLNLHDYRSRQVRKEMIEDQDILRHHFGNDRRRQKMDARRFLDTADGQCWESPGPMLLLLFGRNEISSSIPDCWLSLVATELAEGYFQSNHPVAYERCNKYSTLERTLSRLILQFLERNPALVRRQEDYREIESQISQDCDGPEKSEALRLALLRIINLHEGRVYIILNRPELCEAGLEESCTQYITTMLSLVKEATAELKIMVVLKSELWDFENNKKGVDTRRLDPKLFRPVRLDQGRLT
ncbi:hypothetical protein F5Y19DRAFT_464608 [Xylariaceae sp. FL1651]|nr:hypothetical protein F5Y19DRAFT_464608 [Xylariaceae sp. FL1651]